MKKHVMLFLAVIMGLTLALSGCGKEKEMSEEKTEQQEKPNETKQSDSSETVNESKEPEKEAVEEETAEAVNQEAAEKQTENDMKETKTEAKTAEAVKPAEQKEAPAQAKPAAETESKATDSASVQTAKPAQPVQKEPAAKPASTPAAAKPAEQKPAEQKAETVSISIKGDSEHGTILSSANVEIAEGDSVLDVLKKITKEKRIQLEYSGAGGAAYIEGIDNLYEFDRGPMSGWMFKVNGTFAKKSAGAVTIKSGDRIEWVYTTDLGKDVGAKQ